jgi:hypothetical protein
MQEKKSDPVENLLQDLKTDIESDRKKLTEVLDDLIKYGKTDPDRMVVVAETVAKIGDSLTKQNHLRVDAIKALARRNLREDDKGDDDPFNDIGSAFAITKETEN